MPLRPRPPGDSAHRRQIGGLHAPGRRGSRRDEGAAVKGEDALTAWLRERLGPGHLLGDDAAVLPELAAGERLVATVDSQVAGVHHPADLDPALAARRLLAVNLSDVAAMGVEAGAEPAWALLALSGPRQLDRKRYFEGLLAACDEFGVTLAGGDLAGTEQAAVGTLTLLARLPAGRPPLRRSTARPGHALWVAGTLGESALGQRLVARGARMVAEDGSRAGDRDEPATRPGAAAPARGDGTSGSDAGAREGRPAPGDGGEGDDGGQEASAHPAWRIELPAALELPRDLRTPAARAVRRHLDPASHLAEQLRLGRALAERIGARDAAGRDGAGRDEAGRDAAQGDGVQGDTAEGDGTRGREPGAAMDLSDGPGTDLPRLCRASGVSAEIDAAALPLAPRFAELCRHLDLDPLDLALGGGEDYVLLFTLPEGEAPPGGLRCTRVGRILGAEAEEGGGVTVIRNGHRRPLETRGWDHLE